MSTEPSPIPHLLHVGFPKAGSTWLQHWFEAHPQFAFRPMGLGGAESVYDLVRQSAFERAPSCRVTSLEALAMPAGRYRDFDCAHARRILPKAGSRRRVCDLLAGLFPNAHILLVTRGYRGLLLSAYSELVRGGMQASLQAFAEGQARLARRGIGPYDYDATIALYRDRFDGRVTVLPFELIAADPVTFARQIETVTGVCAFPPSDGVVHPSLSPKALHVMPELSRLIHRVPVRKIRNRLYKYHIRANRNGRGSMPVRLVSHLSSRRVTLDQIPDSVVEAFRGTAETLRGLPHYDRFAHEYLLDD